MIDSGNTHSFISQFLLPKLNAVLLTNTHVYVKVANDWEMGCSSTWREAEWSIQDYLFNQELKVLPLHTYDLILDMDWLETQSHEGALETEVDVHHLSGYISAPVW